MISATGVQSKYIQKCRVAVKPPTKIHDQLRGLPRIEKQNTHDQMTFIENDFSTPTNDLSLIIWTIVSKCSNQTMRYLTWNSTLKIDGEFVQIFKRKKNISVL